MQLLQSMFDPTSLIHTPTQTNDGISQIDHDTGNLIPLFFSKNLTGSMFRVGEKENEMGFGWGRVLPTRLDETLSFLEIRSDPFS